MYISPIGLKQDKYNVNVPSFKAKNEMPSEIDLLKEIRKGNVNPNQVDNTTGETIFQVLVKNNYINAVSYLVAKPSNRDKIINFSANGKYPLDYAVSDKMKTILSSHGAISSPKKDIAEVKSDYPDARETAAKLYMANPVVVTPNQMKAAPAEPSKTPHQATENIEDELPVQEVSKPVESQNTENDETDYFNSFEEVEDNNDNVSENNDKSVYANYSELKTDGNVKKMYEIIGMDDLKSVMFENVIAPINEEFSGETLKANNIDIPNGILIQTPEDITGFVKSLSAETKMPVLQAFNPNEVKPMLNDIKKNYEKTGKKTIILIRGFDNFFTTGANCALDEHNFMLTVENCSKKGALILATADDKCNINKKFLRAGVFDKIVDVPKPDYATRKLYLDEYFRDKHLFSELAPISGEIAEMMDNFTCSDIEKVLADSARRAVYACRNTVAPEILKEELAVFTKEHGITPIDEYNKTAIYDTPEFQRVPIAEDEMKSLDEMGGLDEVKARLERLYVQPFGNLEELKKQLGSAAIPDGAIFYGSAGNGKTLTAKVLARELGLPFYETKLSDVASPYIHDVSKNIRSMAKQLNDKYEKTGEMSVWFLDEFDSLGEARDGQTASHKQEVTNTLLQELNNPSSKGYILIAATNNLDGVDAALKRRGRLGNWIEFSSPTHDEIIDIVRKNLSKTPFTQKYSKNREFLEKIEKEFEGSSISSIVSVLTDAKREAILSGEDFETCIKTCFDEHTKRQMGEFCNKAGLKQHQYRDYDFKNLDELGGMEEVKQALTDNVIDVWNPEIRKALLANRRAIPGGIILEGPAGTGKTTMIETLARQMGVPLFKMNYAQDGNEYIHGVSRNVTEIFDRLALQSKIMKKPVMLFFDEAEKFFPRYADGHQIEEVNTYKDLMNNASDNGIILVGATNHLDLVNQEIIGNPRRMGTVIHVGNPNVKDRQSLVKSLLSELPILEEPLTDEVASELAELAEGMSVGQIADCVDKIIVKAVKKKENITTEQLLDGFKSQKENGKR